MKQKISILSGRQGFEPCGRLESLRPPKPFDQNSFIIKFVRKQKIQYT